MGRVDKVTIIRGTDRQFSLVVLNKETEEPKDLQGFVGGAGSVLQLTLPGEDQDLVLTLDANANGSKVEVETIAAGIAGKVKVTLSDIDTALLKAATGQSMELCIKEGAGPDYDISKVQFLGVLDVLKQVFAE